MCVSETESWPLCWNSLITSLIGALILAILIWRHLKLKEEPPQQNQALCSSPNCVRCQQSRSDKSTIETLTERCNLFIAQREPHLDPDKVLEARYPRIYTAILSLTKKADILLSVYRSSGHELHNRITHPHIWTVPQLQKTPFWDPKTCFSLQSIVSLVPGLYQTILNEYQNADLLKQGWKINTTPAGKWKIYPLFNQGKKLSDNCLHCPGTLRFLESISSFMQDCVYGNAMFSVLHPNSEIEPHTGPCNFRLRCHLPLIAPSGFKVQVAMETREWRTGELLVFDDSYVHRVWHRDGTEKNARVVFIFDIWHPELSSDEIDLLQHCYSEPF